jgi:hypothetical protein
MQYSFVAALAMAVLPLVTGMGPLSNASQTRETLNI